LGRPIRVHVAPQRDGAGDAVVGSEEDPDHCPGPEWGAPATPRLDGHITCLARRACAKPTTELPRCSGIEEAASWDEIRARADSLVGRSIAVRGPLHVHFAVGCTMAFCAVSHCCNDCEAPYVIGADSEALELPRPHGCFGDETRLCCDWRAEGQTVIATGVLHRGGIPKWSTYGLEPAEVCEVRN
jgi:hypothetical protein